MCSTRSLQTPVGGVLYRQGTPVEGTIELLFEGHIMNYIQCMNVDYKSTRKESFYGQCSLLSPRTHNPHALGL